LTCQLDFGGNADREPDPRFHDVDHNLDRVNLEDVGCGQRNSRLELGGDLHHDPHPRFLDVGFLGPDCELVLGFFKGFFIYSCSSDRSQE